MMSTHCVFFFLFFKEQGASIFKPRPLFFFFLSKESAKTRHKKMSLFAGSRLNIQNRFDLFKTTIAYIQSRGRARCKDSEYILLLNRENHNDVKLLHNVVFAENQMKEYCRLLPKDRNLALMFDESGDPGTYNPEIIKQNLSEKYLEDSYCIKSTGALLTRSNAIALIYHYCATLPADEFCNFKPVYRYEDLRAADLSWEERVALNLPMTALTLCNRSNNIFRCTLSLPINARLQQFETYDHTKQDAKARVSLKACIALHEAGDIDDHLIPKSKAPCKVLNEIEREIDENGKQVGSRKRENIYKKRQPLFWEGMADTGSNEDDIHLGPYWLSLIEIVDSSEQPNALPSYRPMCLVTKKPIPEIPETLLFNDNLSLKVHIRNQNEALSFRKQEQVESLRDYTFCFLKCITNKDFSCPRNSINYLIAPLVFSSNPTNSNNNNKHIHTTQQGKIDWAEIANTIANINLPVDLKSHNILDAIVIDTSDQRKKKYFVQNIQDDMTLMSPIPASVITRKSDTDKRLREYGYATFAEYYESHQEFLPKKVAITDMAQPLLRVSRVEEKQLFLHNVKIKQEKKKKEQEPDSVVAWLVPQLCELYPISASVYQTLQIIPNIMKRIDAVLLTHDAKNSLGLSNKIKTDLMLEAFTTSSAVAEKDYQRLEFLGGEIRKKA